MDRIKDVSAAEDRTRAQTVKGWSKLRDSAFKLLQTLDQVPAALAILMWLYFRHPVAHSSRRQDPADA